MPDVPSDISLKDIKNSPSSKGLRLAVGLGVSGVIGFIGWQRGSLSSSGLIGAIVTGTIVTVAGGYGHAVLLVGFFGTSSGLSKLPARTRATIADYADKGYRRDLQQVLANGGVSTAIVLLTNEHTKYDAYIGSLAAATADTWATELGSRFGGQPRHILTSQPVPTGYSGGVTGTGILASAAGGGLIGALSILVGRFDPAFHIRPWNLLRIGIVSGVAGSLADSLIGATLQERRYCDHCAKPTERARHSCGHHTIVIGGVPGLTNDGVNLLGSLIGAVTGRIIGAWGR